MKRNSVNYITKSAMIASLYIALSLISNAIGLASGPVQLRLSEMLTLMPLIFPEAVWGLFIGCFISNILSGCVLWDIVFGSLATLLAAYLSCRFKKNMLAASLFPFFINTLAVPFILKYAYFLGSSWWYLCISVGIGEFIACVILAPMLTGAVKKHLLRRMS